MSVKYESVTINIASTKIEKEKNDLTLSRMSQEFPSIKVLATQSCLTLCNPMDSRPPGSSVHGILQARILEYIVIPFSRESSCARDQTWVFCIAGILYHLSHQKIKVNFLGNELKKKSLIGNELLMLFTLFLKKHFLFCVGV